MNSYQKLKADHKRRYNLLPIKHVFDQAQFDRAYKEMRVKSIKEVGTLSDGGIYKVTDEAAIKIAIAGIDAEHHAAIRQDKTGTGYIYEMFLSEMSNTEYWRLRDVTPLLRILKIRPDELANDVRLRTGFDKAEKEYLKEFEDERKQRGY